jgi:Ca2+-dependent lipid-binding protein
LYNKTNDKKVKGQVRYEIQFFNRIDESVMEVLESTVKVENEKEKTPILNKGILHFNILEGKDLSMFPGICPMVTGYLNGEEMFTTSSKKNTTKPAWNEFKEIYVDDFENDDIELAVIDNRTGMKLASILFPAIEVKDLGVCVLHVS